MQHPFSQIFFNLTPVTAFPHAVPATAGNHSQARLHTLFASSGNSNDDRTIRAGRRRHTESDGAPRERAEAPRRETPGGTGSGGGFSSGGGGGGGFPVSSGGGFSTGGGGGRPPSLLTIGIMILLVICGLPLMFFFGGGSNQSVEQTTGYVTTQPDYAPVATNTPLARPTAARPTPTPKPFKPAASGSTAGQKWLVMLYQDADDQILEKDIFVDFNEAERIGSSDRVSVVAQVDRYRGAFQGDGNWTSTKRFYVTQDNDLSAIHSQEIADLGEVNMSDGQTLVDFVTWAVQSYPADKYVLILSDHGMGWPGGWSDPAPGGRVNSRIPMASALGDELYLMEIDQSLEAIRAQTDIDKFEMIGMDACLMSHLEVFSALAPHARYAVASQETEPSLGWAYTSFLQALTQNPDMDGAELSRLIVDSYIQDDQRIVDDQARADFVSQGSPLSSLFGPVSVPSAGEIAQQLEQNITLTAVDLSAIPNLMNNVNNFAYAMQGINQRAVAQARSYAQSFTSVFGEQVPPSYIDLGNFVRLVQQQSRDQAVVQAGNNVLSALGQAIIAEKHGPQKPGATGISVYFPNSQLYQTPVAGPQSYLAIAERFANDSLWDDFLYFHYTGRGFQAAITPSRMPEAGIPVKGPGAGGVSISDLTVSNTTAAPGRPVLLSAQISGDNVGYVTLFVGYLDQASNSVFVADTDYLESSTTRQIDGVYYPDWGQGSFTMEFEWEPIVFAINDGQNSVVAHFTPRSYGATFKDAVYSVDGTYTYADSGDTRHARLFFRNGVLTQVFGFTGESGTGSPREIIPQTGDTFTVADTWMDLGAQGESAQTSIQPGGMLTFGDQMFRWQELDAAPGPYIVGFIVQDLDGNAYETYQTVTVE